MFFLGLNIKDLDFNTYFINSTHILPTICILLYIVIVCKFYFNIISGELESGAVIGSLSYYVLYTVQYILYTACYLNTAML